MVRAKHSKQKDKTRSISAFVATIVIVVLAFTIFLYRDKLSPSSLGAASEDKTKTISGSEPFTYENGSKQIFTLVGDDLAIASTTGLQLLDSEGNTISRDVFSMVNPAVSSNGDYCAFFDVGGKSLRLYKNGTGTVIDRDSVITTVSVNSSGYFAVAGEEAGYKGSVIVYNSELNPIYKWYSGSGYVLDAAVSPDNSMLAVLCVSASGSDIHILRLTDEKEVTSVTIPNELAFKLSYSKSGNIYALSEKAIHFFSDSGKDISTYSFEDNYLVNYVIGEDFFAVVLSKYVSGSGISLMSFGSDGKVLGSIPLESEPLSLFSQKQKLLVLDGSGVALYNNDLRLQKQNHVVPGFISAVLMPRGEVLLLSSHYGEKCKFS